MQTKNTTYTRQYNLTDHLGNVRVTFDENDSILQEDSYYPFGLTMDGLNYLTGNKSYEKNNYLYNGKELQEDFGLDWYDYGARFYDAQLGRFHTQDAFAEKYYSLSTYQYGANNPVLFIDVNGDSLFVTGTGVNEFKEETNKGLGGFYETNIDENGKVTFNKTDKEGKMTKQQKKFYNSLNKVATHKKNVSVEIVKGDPDVEIGGYYSGKIDISDAIKLGSSNLEKKEYISSQGAIAHEVYEQFEKQVNGKSVLPAHKSALFVENSVNGSIRNEVGTFQVNNKSGKPIGTTIQSINTIGSKKQQVDIIVIKGNVIGVRLTPIK